MHAVGFLFFCTFAQMAQRKNAQLKARYSNFIVAIYAFVCFFGGYLHTHEAVENHGETTQYEKVTHLNPGGDCLACHFFANPQIQHADDGLTIFFNLPQFFQEPYFPAERYFTTTFEHFSRRGPPVV